MCGAHYSFHCPHAVLDAMCSTLDAMGILVEQYHAESCNGQFEIVTAHAPAMTAADDVVRTREALMAVAAQHGYVLSFLPKLYSGSPGNGSHCHISLWKVRTRLECRWSVAQRVALVFISSAAPFFNGVDVLRMSVCFAYVCMFSVTLYVHAYIMYLYNCFATTQR